MHVFHHVLTVKDKGTRGRNDSMEVKEGGHFHLYLGIEHRLSPKK